MKRRVRVPAALSPGARIAVVAPGSVVDRKAVRKGMQVLRSWGYQPVAGQHLFARHGDLAGVDDLRLADLDWAFGSREIDAVWAARGGWGTARLLDRLPKHVGRRARWLFGFSDLTALQSFLLDRGLASWYAPLIADLARPQRFVARDVQRALAQPQQERVFRPGARGVLVSGTADGPLAGGCLAVLASLAGTPWQPRFKGSVLFLEEVHEAPYRVDRMLWQLDRSGMLRDVAGLAFGQFVECKPGRGRSSRRLRAVLKEHSQRLGLPSMTGIPVGHGSKSRMLPLGFDARLDTKRGVLTLKPPA